MYLLAYVMIKPP